MGRDFPPVQTGPGAHPASRKMGTGSFPGVKYGRGVLLTTNRLLVPRSWKSRAIPLPTLWATTGPVMGLLYLLFIHMYGKPEGKRPLRRPRRRWEDNIKMDHQEVGEGGDWMELAQDRDR